MNISFKVFLAAIPRLVKRKVRRTLLLATFTLQISAPAEVHAHDAHALGRLRLVIVDNQSNQETPARLEILDEAGQSFIAEDAVPIAATYIAKEQESALYSESLDFALSKTLNSTRSPYTGTRQFYSSGRSHLVLPEGKYIIRVFKGPEYYIGKAAVTIEASQEVIQNIKLDRFSDLASKGWYSADDHLHLSRVNPGIDPFILKQMQAEDINVGNILSMGRSTSFAITPQSSYGANSIFQDGKYLIVTGQENLRTHILGHTITLGAKEPLRDNDNYLIYRKFWEDAIRQGGINGYAHGGENFNYNYIPSSGPPLVLPHNLMHFIEVLQFNTTRYGIWYDMLNLGFRIAPTAGTDYIGSTGFPGDERFYTHVNGPLIYEKWLKAVRDGRTFVTTGPLLKFQINSKDIGDEITLPKPGLVAIEGEVRFDPAKDVSDDDMANGRKIVEVARNPENGYVIGLELIENGNVIKKFPRTDNSGLIRFKVNYPVSKTSWLALRTITVSSLETTLLPGKPDTKPKKAAIAHTAPIYVTVSGTPPLARQPQSKAVAQAWLASLDLLEARLSPSSIKDLSKMGDGSDDVSEDLLLKLRPRLINEINISRAFFRKFLR